MSSKTREYEVLLEGDSSFDDVDFCTRKVPVRMGLRTLLGDSLVELDESEVFIGLAKLVLIGLRMAEVSMELFFSLKGLRIDLVVSP